MPRSPSKSKQSSHIINEISPPENGEGSTRFNNPAVIAKIDEARADMKREKEGDRIKFEVAFNDAERLHFVRTELDFSPEQAAEFAVECGRPRSTAADLLKLHGHREDGIEWFEARLTLAGGKRVNVSWQAYARDRKLIRKTTQGKGKTANVGEAKEDDQPLQNQIVHLTKERDELKAKIAEVEHERDNARAELDRLRSQGAANT